MGGFFRLRLISSKITPAKKKKSARRKKGEEENKTNVSLLTFYRLLILENCLTEKVYLAVTFSKLQLDIYMHPLLLCRKRFCKGNKVIGHVLCFRKTKKERNLSIYLLEPFALMGDIIHLWREVES